MVKKGEMLKKPEMVTKNQKWQQTKGKKDVAFYMKMFSIWIFQPLIEKMA